MNDECAIEHTYLSKLWGAAKDQFAKFDPTKAMRGLMENQKTLPRLTISL